ncbi:MAG: hypothetical protein FJX80_03725 [Bacteroidetes bacterium]|nr:hypothetical protein [Bacteroidota bacterium]
MYRQGIVICSLVYFCSSCTTSKQYVYLNDIRPTDTILGPIRPYRETLIEPDDQLSIQVSAYNPEDVQMFNTMLASADQGVGMTGGGMNGGAAGVPTTLGYLVDKRGMITLPYVGEFLAAGLTIREMEIYLGKQLERFVKQPIVKVRFLNHFISMIGDKSIRMMMPNERLTLFDVLSSSGDLGISSYRNNILVVREERGYRVTGRVNLLSKAVYENPFFYLQNRDMVYVKPVESVYMQRNDLFTKIYGLGATILTLFLSIYGIIIR